MFPQTNMQYSKLRWLLTFVGFIVYMGDIVTDISLAVTYFLQGQYVWCGLTVLFILTGLLVTQIFSCAWYLDDMDKKQPNAGMSKVKLVALHVLGTGTFMRYCDLLKRGFKKVWQETNSNETEQMKEKHHKMFCMAADLSMLKMFEAFLESVPQLLLQLYILLGHTEWSVMKCISLVFSFLSVAWALVDYRRCLRRSIPTYREMPSGLPTIIYLLYKLCTITSHVLSCSFFLILCPYNAVTLAFLWLPGTIWAYYLKTNFCSSRALEILYRGVVGVILVFTFFNVQGQNTRGFMITYYGFYSVINFSAPVLVFVSMPELSTSIILFAAGVFIFVASLLGLVFLVLYYGFLHPRGEMPDEVDGMENEADTRKLRNLRDFLQP